MNVHVIVNLQLHCNNPANLAFKTTKHFPPEYILHGHSRFSVSMTYGMIAFYHLINGLCNMNI